MTSEHDIIVVDDHPLFSARRHPIIEDGSVL